MSANDSGNNKKHNVIVVNGNFDDPLTPKSYGFWSVQWSTQGLPDLTKRVLTLPGNDGYERLQHRIAKDQKIFQYLLIAYQTSAHYTYCSKVLNLPHSILDEVWLGIREGIKTLQTNGSPIGEQNARAIFQSVEKYAQAIYAELGHGEPDPEVIRLDSGLSAAEVYKDLLAVYDPHGSLVHERNPFDEVTIQKYISFRGIPIVKSLRDELKIEYLP